MDRSALRKQVLRGFYEKDDGRYHDPFEQSQSIEEKIAIEAACRHLRDEGLIEWNQPLGSDFVGHGKITGQGATRYEQWDKPVLPNVSYHFGSAQNVQIGDGNVMNVTEVAQRVEASIDSSPATLEQKAEAKSLWRKLTNNQTFAAVIGAVVGAAASAAKGS